MRFLANFYKHVPLLDYYRVLWYYLPHIAVMIDEHRSTPKSKISGPVSTKLASEAQELLLKQVLEERKNVLMWRQNCSPFRKRHVARWLLKVHMLNVNSF